MELVFPCFPGLRLWRASLSWLLVTFLVAGAGGVCAASEKIVFSKEEASGGNDLWMMNPDGSGQERLTDEAKSGISAYHPSLYANGTKLIYQRGYNRARMDLAMQQITPITTDGATNGAWAYGAPNVSPDGTKITYTYGQSLAGSCASCTTFEIYTMNSDGTNNTRLTNNSYRDATPIWSPDGTKLLVTHYQGAPSSDCSNQTDVYVLDLATRVETKLYGTSAYDWGMDWKSAGILHSTNGSAMNRTNADGSGSVQANWTKFSPDATRIVYNSNATGTYELYVANADGSSPAGITSGLDVDGGFTGMSGATFYVGYGTSTKDMLGNLGFRPMYRAP